ncbi:MAG: hypothetical protein ABSE84_00145 [Isosphaeraceae bacterium]|jgi:hypothetical protein
MAQLEALAGRSGARDGTAIGVTARALSLSAEHHGDRLPLARQPIRTPDHAELHGIGKLRGFRGTSNRLVHAEQG